MQKIENNLFRTTAKKEKIRYSPTCYYLILFMILFFSFGCASSRFLGQLPQKPEDFTLHKDVLISKFPDIAEYHKGNGSVGLLGYCTPIDDVISQLGEPVKKTSNWFSFPAIYSPLFLNKEQRTNGVRLDY